MAYDQQEVLNEMMPAVALMSARFGYANDGNDGDFTGKSWRVLTGIETGTVTGDCEDYALTLLWVLVDYDVLQFVKAIVDGTAEFWTGTHNGNGHAVIRYKGMWMDNNLPNPVDTLPSKYNMTTKRSPWQVLRFIVKSWLLRQA